MDDVRSLVGSTLGHYRIESMLGEGGMGIVYLAFDMRLERRVAIKVLRAEALSDPERKRRFVLEAKAASALNHPNIVTIHDIAEEDSVNYIVMEYVAGDTLAKHIHGAALPATQTLDYAIQIAGALARAHSAGIVHRDIKPENILVNHEGRVKVLDFGLAKLMEAQETAPQQQQWDPEAEGTLYGSVLGTAQYMSPEQARGEPADARSDIFSFGALLYEMLTGASAFAAPTQFDAMQAVLRREPPPGALRSAPPKLAAVALRCLRKEPNDRFQSMEQVQQALEKAQVRKSAWWWIVPATAVAVLLAAVVIAKFNGPGSRPRTNIIPVTTYPGQEIEPSISPDGSRVAFIWDGDTGKNVNLYVKPVEGGEPVRLTDGSAQLEAIPVWSPKGDEIAFLRRHSNGDGLFDVLIVSASAGAERKIAVAGRGLDWSPDGKSLVIMEPEPRKPRGLLLLDLATGETRRLTAAPEGVLADRSPRFSPDGKRVAFSRTGYHNESTISVVAVKSGEITRVFEEKRGTLGLDWTADAAEIVYAWASVAAQPSLYRVSAAGGVPEGILSQAYYPSVAKHANRMAFQQTIHNQNIWRIARPGPLEKGGDRAARAKQIISSSQTNNDMQYSPDGSKIAFNTQRTGNGEIWIADADGRHATQITFGKGRDVDCGSPRFSPDGRQLVFDCHTGTGTDVFTAPVDGGTPHRLTTDQSSFVPGWTRDGKWIYYTSEHEHYELWRIPAAGGTAQQITRNGGYEAKESLAGGTLYYSKKPAGDGGLWTVPVEGGLETPVAGMPTNIFRRNWDISSTGIVFALNHDDAIQFFDFKTRKVSPVYPLDRALQIFNRNLAISADGRTILWAQVDVDSRDIAVLDHFR